MSVLKRIYQLQLVDSEWEEHSSQLAEVTAGLGEAEEVLRARADVAAAEQALHETRVLLRSAELELGSVNAQWEDNQRDLYRGKGKSPREISGLEQQSRALARRKSELEDRQLALMIGIDEQQAEIAERKARLRQIELSWQEQQAVLNSQANGLRNRLAELETLRRELRSSLPPSELELYDDLRDTLGGVAAALLKRGICQGCGVDVPTDIALAVVRGEGLHLCPVCGRILCGGS